MNKRYQAGDYEARHLEPAWRDRADFIITANISESKDREWEQLWARRIENNRFEVCCIPFFVHDLALGDEVETDDNDIIHSLLKRSGHSTFRVWLKDSLQTTRDEISQMIRENGLQSEWSSDNLVAIDAANDERAQKIADFLIKQEKAGRLTYETGRTK
jgi:hypothetical protein